MQMEFTKQITEDVFDCLEKNNYTIDINNVFVLTNHENKLEVRAIEALNRSDNMLYSFRMLLTDYELICIEDESIKLDMTFYKNDNSRLLKHIEDFKKREESRTPLEKANFMVEDINRTIEYNENYEEDEETKIFIKKSIPELIDELKEFEAKHNIKATSRILNIEGYTA